MPDNVDDRGGCSPIESYLVEMVRRPTPSGCGVVEGSTPVVAFGNPNVANVATLGINPSRIEFTDSEVRPLPADKRRLATLKSLGANTSHELTDQQVRQVIDECAAYFHKNPYRRWFDPLDEVLTGLGVSYYDDTACHLDIVQWATDPVWGKMTDRVAKDALLTDGVSHLQAQLHNSAVTTIVVNGAAVWNQLRATGLATSDDAGTLAYGNNGRHTTLRTGRGNGIRFLGWTMNVQSTPGVRSVDRVALADWLKTATADDHAYLERRTVASRDEFTTTLRNWLERSTATTLGDTGAFGRSWVIALDLGADRVLHLNADTTRDAVERYLRNESDPRNESVRWRVIANRNGLVNKVEFTESGPPTVGWYAYLTTEAATEGPL